MTITKVHSASPGAQIDRAPAERLAQIFKEVDWLIPAFVSVGFVSMFAARLEREPADTKLNVVRQTLATLYDADYLAAMMAERYSTIMHVRDFKCQIDESIKAYFSDYKVVAVAAMVPVVEGIVRKIATRQNRNVGRGTKGLNFEFDALVERERNSPNCYGERLVMLEALRDFIRDRFLKKTDDYAGMDELNRHGIVHGVFDGYGEDMNFFRIITLLDLLCFSIGLIEGGSGCAPNRTPRSRALAEHYERLRAVAKRESAF